jgi:hypothetical protein
MQDNARKKRIGRKLPCELQVMFPFIKNRPGLIEAHLSPDGKFNLMFGMPLKTPEPSL